MSDVLYQMLFLLSLVFAAFRLGHAIGHDAGWQACSAIWQQPKGDANDTD